MFRACDAARFDSKKTNRLLIVEDEPALSELLTVALSEEYEVIQAFDGRQALPFLDPSQVDLVLLDMNLPVLDGASVLKVMKQRSVNLPVIVMSGHYDFGVMVKDVVTCLRKPFTIGALEEAIKQAFVGERRIQ